MAHVEKIRLSSPLDRDYNVIGVNTGEDVTMSVPIEHEDWIDSGYNVTIYDEKNGSTIVSAGINSDPKEIMIDDFASDAKKCIITIEDRSDINNIETEETIGYIFFKKFKRGQTAATEEGTFQYLQADDSTLDVKYFTTSFEEV